MRALRQPISGHPISFAGKSQDRQSTGTQVPAFFTSLCPAPDIIERGERVSGQLPQQRTSGLGQPHRRRALTDVLPLFEQVLIPKQRLQRHPASRPRLPTGHPGTGDGGRHPHHGTRRPYHVRERVRWDRSAAETLHSVQVGGHIGQYRRRSGEAVCITGPSRRDLRGT